MYYANIISAKVKKVGQLPRFTIYHHSKEALKLSPLKDTQLARKSTKHDVYVIPISLIILRSLSSTQQLRLVFETFDNVKIPFMLKQTKKLIRRNFKTRDK